MDETHKRLIANIRFEAKRKKIAVTHLPDLAGLSRSHFWEVMAGRKSPTLRWIISLSEALNVDASDLLIQRANSKAVRPD